MILIVAEKNSVGNAISAVVGAADSHKGYNEGGNYIVSWCAGHLVEMKYPDDYGGGWDSRWSFSQLPMIPDNWQFKVSPKTSFQYNILKSLMQRNDVTEIICATDADREGETIFRYVYNMVGCRKPVKRLWVSSLEETAIRGALQNMKTMSAYDNLYSAGYSRAKADWLVGMNGSRLFSCRYGSKLNIGRVQTPTLAMIVQRDAEVNGFVKQKYFTADLNCGDLILSSARIDDENTADMLVSACNGSTAVVSSVKREVKTEKAPKLYDLTTLQREANKAFGYTAQQTLDYTQSLYEGKLVTYPRTDSQYLSDDMKQTAFDVAKLCDTRFGFGISHTPDISKCILPYFENKQMSEIAPKDVIAWQNKMMSYRDEKGNGYSPVYLKRLHNQLSAIFNHAVKFYDLKSNPAAKVGNMGKAKAKEMDFWTKDEYLKFADSMMDKPISFYAFEMLYWCGLRLGEMLALTKDDFDFDKKTVSVTKSYQCLNGRDVITDPKTPKSVRKISMPDFLCDEIEEYIGTLYGIGKGDRVFPISKSYLHHEMTRGSKEQNIKRIRIHDLRHSHVSLLIEMGFSPVAIADRVGHESIDITYRYAHLFPTKQVEIADKLNIERSEDNVAEE